METAIPPVFGKEKGKYKASIRYQTRYWLFLFEKRAVTDFKSKKGYIKLGINLKNESENRENILREK